MERLERREEKRKLHKNLISSTSSDGGHAKKVSCREARGTHKRGRRVVDLQIKIHRSANLSGACDVH